MAMLSDAELLLGLSRHLSAYSMGPDRAALENLEFAGWVFDMAFRIRGSTTSTADRVRAIGLDVGLGPRSLRAVIATMEQLGWLTVVRDSDGAPVSVNERITAPGDLIAQAPNVLAIVLPSDCEVACLALLRATTLQPLERSDAMQRAADAAGGAEQAADEALRRLTATNLVRRVVVDDGREVLYNPNVWTQGDSIASAALRAADARATTEVGALLEEVAASPGLPEARVTSTNERWVHFAVAHGLVQRSLIQTVDGTERGFLFTPHLNRDPFGATAGDASGQVRQLVGSMIYATSFARFRLDDPAVFLRSLIRRGVAGNASPIGTDYPMLETAGIVRVVPGRSEDRFAMELLQSEIAEEAVTLLEGRGAGRGSASARPLSGQTGYTHIERDRARLATQIIVDEAETARLMSALREAATDPFGGTR